MAQFWPFSTFAHQRGDLRFWMSTTGTVLYIASMWVIGLIQRLMWRATNSDGTLTYSFVESLSTSFAGYVVRFTSAISAGVYLTVFTA